MLSRLALRNGSAIAAIALRSSAPCVSAAPQKLLLSTSVPQRMPNKMPEEGGKVRFGFIPEEWFQFMYKKTGVTGPYVFGTGMILFLLNKEIYVLGPETVHAAVALSMFVYGIKRFGPGIAAWADKKREEKLEQAYEGRNANIEAYKDAIDHEKTEQWRLDGRKQLFDARRENVAMRMEIEYRERLQQVSEAVQKKLDYHVELENTKRRLEQQHMVRWIEQNVVKSITPQQEKDIMNTCISNLKNLGASA
ncbi:ATP synthase F(0) complex subunit B1, mitochondrial-like [Lytechinus variegatus]|uniref:ATP synthase F(0) complex subunit B1, mitochondrial-like n=1 Tax=Lytechinus variegatus TaxID=7654 RepID=UPI001BB236F0|nr:ATP synthase F(0) complex subunit B1, mitochondrial-like [Lytechinus variegatus]